MTNFKLILIFTLLPFYIIQSQTHKLSDEFWSKAERAKDQNNWGNAALLYEKSAEAEEKSFNPRVEELAIALNNAAFYHHKNNII